MRHFGPKSLIDKPCRTECSQQHGEQNPLRRSRFVLLVQAPLVWRDPASTSVRYNRNRSIADTERLCSQMSAIPKRRRNAEWRERARIRHPKLSTAHVCFGAKWNRRACPQRARYGLKLRAAHSTGRPSHPLQHDMTGQCRGGPKCVRGLLKRSSC